MNGRTELLLQSQISIYKQQIIYEGFGSGALSGKMLLVRIIENNKVSAYFRAG